MKKKLLTLLLVLAAVFALLTISAGAENQNDPEPTAFPSMEPTPSAIVDSGTCGENLTWELDSSGLLVVRGTGEMDDLDYSDNPWDSNESIKKVKIEDGVTNIKDRAFQHCANLTDVSIPNSVTRIGANAFYGCGFTNITIPNSVTIIGSAAFAYCTELTSIIVPSSVINIESAAFEECSGLSSVMIQEGVTSIGDWAFEGCRQLLSITIPEGVTSIGSWAFGRCYHLASVSIPSSVNSIGITAFEDCDSLEEIIIADGNPTYKVEDGIIFSKDGTQLVFCPSSKNGSYAIPRGVTEIMERAFSCTELTRVTIPNTVTTIGAYAFYQSHLEKLNLPRSVEVIGEHAFDDSTLIAVSMNGVSSIGSYAFYECDELELVDLPESLTEIGGMAFSGCTKLVHISVKCKNVKIDSGAFENTAFYNDENNWDNGVLYIGNALVAVKENVQSINFKSDTYSISPWAFRNNENLTELIFPETVAYIGAGAFFDCTNLKTAKLPDQLQRIESHLFDGCTSLAGSIAIPDGVTYIGPAAFRNCSKITDIIIPDSVTEIDGYNWDNGAFSGCSGLTSLVIPESVTRLGSSVFCNCTGLTELRIPDSVTEMGLFIINGCSNLETLYVGSGLNEDSGFTFVMYLSDFSGCDRLQNIFVSEDSAYYCSIDGVLFSKDKSTIYKYPNARTGPYIVPDGVTTISSLAFTYADHVTYISLPETVSVVSIRGLTAHRDSRLYLPASLEGTAMMMISDNVTDIYFGGYEGQINWTDTGYGEFRNCTIHYDHKHTWDAGVPQDTAAGLSLFTCTECGVMRQMQRTITFTAQPVNYLGSVNSTAKFTAAATGDGLTYQWQYSDDNGATWLPSSLKSGTYSAKLTAEKSGRMVRCVVTDAAGNSFASDAASMWISNLKLTGQPADYSGAVNSTAKFTVTASGEGLSYQWQYSDDNGATWLPSSLKTATYSAKLTADKNGRMVRCIVSDKSGASITSSAANMTISSIKITAQPVDYVGAVNSTAKFTVAASGEGLTYRWQYSDDSGATWLPSSLKSNTYSAKLTAEKDGRMVRCVISDQYGASVISNAAEMIVKGLKITTQPVDYVGAVNSTARFTVAASGTGLTYQWQYSDDGGKTWLASSIKSAAYSAKFTADKNDRMVRCIVSDPSGASVTSDAAKMILSAPVITAQPKNYVGAVNSTAKFTVTASGSGVTYQWQYSDDNGRTWLASSIKSATYSAKFTAEKDGRMVRCIVKDANGNTVTSNSASMKLS